jgi:hypothetical protein
MSEREDLRVRRTKKALADAFIELLSQKTFDEITVNELCDHADIRRATFYKHYSDKYDFLSAYICLLRDKFDYQIWRPEHKNFTTEYFVSYAKQLIIFISENSAAIDNICNSILFSSVLSIIAEQNYKDTYDRLCVSVSQGMKLNAPVDVVAGMITGGVVGAVYLWLVNGRKSSPDALSEQVGSVIKSIIGQQN